MGLGFGGLKFWGMLRQGSGLKMYMCTLGRRVLGCLYGGCVDFLIRVHGMCGVCACFWRGEAGVRGDDGRCSGWDIHDCSLREARYLDYSLNWIRSRTWEVLRSRS